MSSSGALILFVALGLIAIVGMSALNSLQGEVNTTDANVTSAVETANTVSTPIFTVFSFAALAIICVAVLNSFRNL